MAGIEPPCWDEVVLISAPVAMNRILLYLPFSIAGRIVEQSTDAQHPHPEPPAWTS